jgi:hypothetical protein
MSGPVDTDMFSSKTRQLSRQAGFIIWWMKENIESVWGMKENWLLIINRNKPF